MKGYAVSISYAKATNFMELNSPFGMAYLYNLCCPIYLLFLRFRLIFIIIKQNFQKLLRNYELGTISIPVPMTNVPSKCEDK